MSLGTVNTDELSKSSIGIECSEESKLGDSSPFSPFPELPTPIWPLETR